MDRDHPRSVAGEDRTAREGASAGNGSRGPQETRWSLIESAARGDGAARSLFARTYLPLVRSCFEARWRRRPAEEIDDAVQETFVVCFRQGGVLDRAVGGVREFRAYLLGVVRHVALRFEERRLRRPAGSLDEHQVEARDATVSQVFDREWARMIMMQAAERMRARAELGDPTAQRRMQLLQLRFQQGMALRDIAVEWQMEPEALHRLHAAARREFHTCLRMVVREEAVLSAEDLDAECRRLLALLRP